MNVGSKANSYPAGFFGRFRFYTDLAESYSLAAVTSCAVFFLLNLGFLFFTIDQEWSPLTFLTIAIIGALVSMVIGLIKIFRKLPHPKVIYALKYFFYSFWLGVCPPVTMAVYLAACIAHRQLNFRAVKTFATAFLLLPVFTVTVLIVMRSCVQCRYLPTSSMQPNLHIGDRLALENISALKGTPVQRGQIVVFYPPSIEVEGPQTDMSAKLGELTGLPFFPNRPAYIKRVIGLPGDRVEIRAKDGVYLNSKKLDESTYITEPAQYNLKRLSDIKGLSTDGAEIQPYQSEGAIVVPPHMVFVLGDTRDNSQDSHVFGFVDQHSIVGRAWVLFSPITSYMHKPFWHRPQGACPSLLKSELH